MTKKIILTALAGVLLLVFTDNTFARSGYQNSRFRRQESRQEFHRDSNHHTVFAVPQCRRPIAVRPSRGFFIGRIIVISF